MEKTIQIHVKGNQYLSIYQSFTGRQETMPVIKGDDKVVLLGDSPRDLKDTRDLMDHIMDIMQGDYSKWEGETYND